MNGASTAIGVAGPLYPPIGHNRSPSSPEAKEAQPEPVAAEDGALASAKRALSQSLGSSGFLDPSAPFDQSFAGLLQYQPVEGLTGDSQPEIVQALLSSIKQRLAANAEQTLAAQARVGPKAAVELLT
jgi:hypothetical protein